MLSTRCITLWSWNKLSRYPSLVEVLKTLISHGAMGTDLIALNATALRQ